MINHARLRIVRESRPRKLTQEDVARGAGFSRSNYAKKEKGDVPVTLEDLEKLARYYGMPVSELVEETGEEDSMSDVVLELSKLISELHRKLDDKDKRIMELEAKLEGREIPVRPRVASPK